MTVRLDETKVAREVDTAHISPEPVDPGDVVAVSLTPPLQPPPNLYTSPVAALLQRAHHRPTTEDWCNGP
ncbi:hypothetical protein [Streptomyces sp. NBC_01727]|uniref:hypothetical protein n=1 Tax=Streptomyces sp. NBC_01727 TaxID=2975924 RepID=UPI002E0E369B|nr:hypothetical protein OIE76_42790 [Streptomyces sp. NBC_01727]